MLTLKQKLVLFDACMAGLYYYPSRDERRTVRALQRLGLVEGAPGLTRIEATPGGHDVIDAIVRAALTHEEE